MIYLTEKKLDKYPSQWSREEASNSTIKQEWSESINAYIVSNIKNDKVYFTCGYGDLHADKVEIQLFHYLKNH